MNDQTTEVETADLQQDTDESITLTITAEDKEKYKRLDQFLSDKVAGYSRTFLKNLFQKDQITVAEESPTSPNIELKKLPPVGTIINVNVPPLLASTALPENIPLEILWEDEHMVFVNKPAGLVTHPAPGKYTGTLVNAILYHCKDIQGVGDQKRPGIVHRLIKAQVELWLSPKRRPVMKPWFFFFLLIILREFMKPS